LLSHKLPLHCRFFNSLSLPFSSLVNSDGQASVNSGMSTGQGLADELRFGIFRIRITPVDGIGRVHESQGLERFI
jgi:hypothetical protein